MLKNKIELINALKNEYDLNPLDMFSLKGIAKYNNMIFRINNNKLQLYFPSLNVWKNAMDDFSDEVFTNLLEEKVSLYKSVAGSDTPVVPKGSIVDLSVFEDDGKQEVLGMAVADESVAKAVVDNYKALESISPVKKAAVKPEAEEKPAVPASGTIDEVNERARIREQADKFNERLGGLHVEEAPAEETSVVEENAAEAE